jgi:hypothetical protein
MVFSSLASKLVATVYSNLASKPAATVFAGLASKPVVTVSLGLASKPVVGFLVEPQNQGGGGFPGLGLKTGSSGLVIWASKSGHIAKLKDGPKRAMKLSQMILEKVLKMV